MSLFNASKPLTLLQLSGRFVWSRGGLCILAVMIAVGCRAALPQPLRLFEIAIAAVMVALWPTIERWVHERMHFAEGTAMYARHKLHHEHPHPDNTFGEWSTYLLYLALPWPWFYFQWAWLETCTVMVLGALCVYEFVHFSAHCRYRPLTAWGKRVRLNHRLHHRDSTTRLEVVFPRVEPATPIELANNAPAMAGANRPRQVDFAAE